MPDIGLPAWLPWLSMAFLGLMAFLVAALLGWSWMGTVEESVPGVGQIAPEGRLRRVMSPANGIVAAVYVTENRHVKAGETLLVLDPEAASLEQEGFQEQLMRLRQESMALEAAATGSNPGRLGPIEQAWLDSTLRSYHSQGREIDMQISATRHAHQQAIAQKESLRAVLESKKQQLAKLRHLYEQGGLPQKELSDYEQDVRLQQGELDALNEAVSTREAEIRQTESRRRTLGDRYRQDLMGRMMDHANRMTALRSQIASAQLAMKREVIVAPISGVINEQLIHGKGEVVMGGAPLLTIVPDDAGLMAEIQVANRDLAYIHTGQRVNLRLEAFPNSRFGMLHGTIISISPSSHADAQGHPFFILKIQPDKTALKDENGQTHPLKAGMSVTADILTRKKRILDFFTESMHERLDHAFREPTLR